MRGAGVRVRSKLRIHDYFSHLWTPDFQDLLPRTRILQIRFVGTGGMARIQTLTLTHPRTHTRARTRTRTHTYTRTHAHARTQRRVHAQHVVSNEVFRIVGDCIANTGGSRFTVGSYYLQHFVHNGAGAEGHFITLNTFQLTSDAKYFK